jgi:hypothetical protein
MAACGSTGDSVLAKTFASAAEGIAVRYPDAWRLTTRNDGVVPDPALCFALAPKADAKVELRVVEYLPPYFNPHDLPSYRDRPGEFHLSSFRKGDQDWSPGAKTFSFQQARRVFFVGVVLPATADPATRRSIETILNSMTISASGRCRPTAGVGSKGIPGLTRKRRTKS